MLLLLSTFIISKTLLSFFILYMLYINFFSKLNLYLVHFQGLTTFSRIYFKFITLPLLTPLWSPIFKKNFFLGHFINNICWR